MFMIDGFCSAMHGCTSGRASIGDRGQDKVLEEEEEHFSNIGSFSGRFCS